MDEQCNMLKCPGVDCSFTSSLTRDFLSHFYEAHPNTSIFLCKRCSFVCKTTKRFLKHIDSNHSTDDGSVFKIFIQATSDLKNKLVMRNHKFKIFCKHCSFTTTKVAKFNCHLGTHKTTYDAGSDEEEKNSNDTLRNLSGLEETTVFNHLGNLEDLNKEIEFSINIINDGASLDKTTNNFKSWNMRSCPICQATVVNLSSHLVVHSKSRNYECEYCDYSTNRKKDLFIHSLVHSKEKSYICKICDKAFGTSSDLSKHKKIHEDERRFECKICMKKFRHKHHVKRHLTTKHSCFV